MQTMASSTALCLVNWIFAYSTICTRFPCGSLNSPRPGKVLTPASLSRRLDNTVWAFTKGVSQSARRPDLAQLLKVAQVGLGPCDTCHAIVTKFKVIMVGVASAIEVALGNQGFAFQTKMLVHRPPSESVESWNKVLGMRLTPSPFSSVACPLHAIVASRASRRAKEY